MWNVVLSTLIVYLLYLNLGGSLFLFLEAVNELGIRQVKKTNASFDFGEIQFTLLEDGFTDKEINHTIEHWKDEFLQSDIKNGDASSTLPTWTYTNAFFFAFHLCSTIGYGDISPNTTYGQLLAVFYATVGIPFHILFFKFFGESFTKCYQETVTKISGEDEPLGKKKLLADIIFFITWTLVFFLLPSIIFMFTEDWSFVEGVYYCFITLTTVGLGDYVAGNYVENNAYYFLYKLFILCWMFYGLAFTAMLVDVLTHKYQINLLFVWKWKWKKCSLSIKRVYVDVEKLDIHFRLLKSESVKHKFSVWGIRRDTQHAMDFQTPHLGNLAILSERVQGEILSHLSEYESSKVDAFPILP